MRTAYYPPLLLALLLWPACSLVGNDDLDDFRQQRGKWEQQAFLNYAYTLNVACFCQSAGPVRVDVRADSVYMATALNTDKTVGSLEAFRIETIDGLFEVLEYALKTADEVHVDYDEQYGFPTRIEIDYYKDAVDDEVAYQASDLAIAQLEMNIR